MRVPLFKTFPLDPQGLQIRGLRMGLERKADHLEKILAKYLSPNVVLNAPKSPNNWHNPTSSLLSLFGTIKQRFDESRITLHRRILLDLKPRMRDCGISVNGPKCSPATQDHVWHLLHSFVINTTTCSTSKYLRWAEVSPWHDMLIGFYRPRTPSQWDEVDEQWEHLKEWNKCTLSILST